MFPSLTRTSTYQRMHVSLRTIS